MREVVKTVKEYVGPKCLGVIVADLVEDIRSGNGRQAAFDAKNALWAFCVPMATAREFVSGLTVAEAMQIKKEA